MKTRFRAPGGPAFARTTVVALVFLAALAGAMGCGGEQLQSRWRDRAVVVDGSSADWDGAMIPFEEENLGVGVMNDDEFLYLCLVATDRADQMQILTGGLTLWVDPAGGKDKAFGIRYPVGGRPEGAEPGARGGRGAGREPGERGERGLGRETGERGDPPDLDSLLVRFSPPERLEIRNGEDELMESYPLDATPGLEARIGSENGALVCELKIPLEATADRPFAVAATKGRVGLGLETVEIERPKMQRPDGMMGGGPGGGMGGGPPGGGGGGMGGGPPGGGRGGGRGMGAPPGMMGAQAEPIDLWARVILATPATGTAPAGD